MMCGLISMVSLLSAPYVTESKVDPGIEVGGCSFMRHRDEGPGFYRSPITIESFLLFFLSFLK